jgi:predicted dienelactone hydrolase
MRIFELLLILTNIPYLVSGLFWAQRPKWLNWLPVGGLLLLVIHLVVEGYRWQMFPAYLLTAVLLVVALRPLWNRPSAPKRWLVVIGSLLGLILLVIAAALPTLLPIPMLPAATGAFGVGTRTLYLVDSSRQEIYAPDAADSRELMVQIWYPAAPNATGEDAAYLPALDVAGPTIAAQFDLPSFLFGHVNLTPMAITENAAAASGETLFPVILFSHGLTGIRMQNTTVARELASHGYVVIAADHTYGNALTVFPDGRVIFYEGKRLFTNGRSNPAEANQLVVQWADDISFMLDQLAQWHEADGHWLNGRLDLSRVGVFGHSTGGGATLEFCQRDARCDAGIGLDAWVLPMTDVETAVLRQPFMFISTPAWLGETNQAAGVRLVAAAANEAYELTIADTQHYDFTDLVLFSPLTPQLGLSGTIDSSYSLTMQNEYVLAFFDQYVKGVGGEVLERPSPYPELQIERK